MSAILLSQPTVDLYQVFARQRAGHRLQGDQAGDLVVATQCVVLFRLQQNLA